MTLARKHRGDACAPRLLDRAQDAQFVIDDHVVRRRIAPLDGIEHPFLVQVDEHAPADRVPQPGALHLARLKYHIPVRENDRNARAATTRQRCQRTRIQALRERVIDQEERDQQQLRVVEVFQAVALQRPQIVGVTELIPQLLEDGPVALATRRAKLALQMLTQVVLDGIVIQEGIVHIEEKHELFAAARHVSFPCRFVAGSVLCARGPQGSRGVNARRRRALGP